MGKNEIFGLLFCRMLGERAKGGVYLCVWLEVTVSGERE